VFGGVEAGGTKFVCVIGTGPDDIAETQRADVAGPAETLGAALDLFRRVLAAGTPLDAIGIGSFGPVELHRSDPGTGSSRRRRSRPGRAPTSSARSQRHSAGGPGRRHAEPCGTGRRPRGGCGRLRLRFGACQARRTRRRS
jgi:fructokinase